MSPADDFSIKLIENFLPGNATFANEKRWRARKRKTEGEGD